MNDNQITNNENSVDIECIDVGSKEFKDSYIDIILKYDKYKQLKLKKKQLQTEVNEKLNILRPIFHLVNDIHSKILQNKKLEKSNQILRESNDILKEYIENDKKEFQEQKQKKENFQGQILSFRQQISKNINKYKALIDSQRQNLLVLQQKRIYLLFTLLPIQYDFKNDQMQIFNQNISSVQMLNNKKSNLILSTFFGYVVLFLNLIEYYFPIAFPYSMIFCSSKSVIFDLNNNMFPLFWLDIKLQDENDFLQAFQLLSANIDISLQFFSNDVFDKQISKVKSVNQINLSNISKLLKHLQPQNHNVSKFLTKKQQNLLFVDSDDF
eukprot:TRINITY_DN7267_c0_g1_i1.p1 TRINITY_DN7267_c0_g1~~TRINITY_DN7267_c0_g1_i1.p1  ORF type:complete len:335 (-),score=80.24 TRINITY_DN7267_c0_g1_i1:24-998(-)